MPAAAKHPAAGAARSLLFPATVCLSLAVFLSLVPSISLHPLTKMPSTHTGGRTQLYRKALPFFYQILKTLLPIVKVNQGER